MKVYIVFFKAVLFFILCLFANTAYGLADEDGDGLVDVTTLEQLNAIRFNLAGTGRTLVENGTTDSSGCFGNSSGAILCNGYELVNDLDFDTNADGMIDQNDDYWNAGLGWEPIGDESNSLNALLEGNYFTIRNLYINRPSQDYVGLIGYTFKPVYNLGLVGPNTEINGDDFVGSLAGKAENIIADCYSDAIVRGKFNVGGLVGQFIGGFIGHFPPESEGIRRSYTSGYVEGTLYTGGLVGSSSVPMVGYAIEDSHSSAVVKAVPNISTIVSNQYAGGVVGVLAGKIKNVYSIGLVEGPKSGGIIGHIFYDAELYSSYWDTQASSQTEVLGELRDSTDSSFLSSNVFGLTTQEMQCRDMSGSASCDPTSTVYDEWETSVWDFGTDNEYPVLIINGLPQRDADGDYVFDLADDFPNDPTEWLDTDGDGVGNNTDDDDDGDGVLDVDDAFPLDGSESADFDNDGIGDNADTDDDNDNFSDIDEITCGSDPLSDSSLPTDTDGDGLCDNGVDTDDDNDNFSDIDETICGSDPLSDSSLPTDTDGDGLCDNGVDSDDDNDGVDDSDDAFPLDETESVDTDGDGIGNNADLDDDNDSYSDIDEEVCGSDPLSGTSLPLDTDNDGLCDNGIDSDDDNDGVEDSEDAFPLDEAESVDTDGDGVGNNADTDDDGDGVEDSEDAFPLDETESVDTDGDGIGNNADTDDDNDGVEDNEDAFPLDETESVDTDGDGIGNNADTDDDNDGVEDNEDAFPLDETESVDTDGDGIGNNADTDDDGDGVEDNEDAFPLDETESVDTDGDGIGNNADTDDDGDGVADEQDAFPLDRNESVDTDGDGVGNNADTDDDGDGVADVNDAFPLDGSRSAFPSSGGGSMSILMLLLLCCAMLIRRERVKFDFI